MEIIIIAAMSENRVIGKNNTLPWSIKEDMAHFLKLTKGWPCVMGRKTWESLPMRPLSGRLNVIVSRTLTADSPEMKFSPMEKNDNIIIRSSLLDAIRHCSSFDKVFICGGGDIYLQALSLANKMELTIIHQTIDGDTFFPEIDQKQWEITNTEDFDIFSFVSYTKKL